MGLGLVRRLIKGYVDIYDRPLGVDEILARIEGVHRPYVTELARLIKAAHESHGVAWHVNCHSMRSAGRKRGRSIPRADIVLGDRDGTSCGAEFTAFVAGVARDLGYQVAINDPFKGAELVARFGQPDEGMHSLQPGSTPCRSRSTARSTWTRTASKSAPTSPASSRTWTD